MATYKIVRTLFALNERNRYVVYLVFILHLHGSGVIYIW